MILKPRDYQAEAIQSIFDYYDEGKKGNPILALPTGTGKSIIIAFFIYYVLQKWSKQRFLVLTHVQELIEQNALKLKTIWPMAPMGINSAGLKSRDTKQSVIFGGIQSLVNDAAMLGYRDLVIIDEAHLVSDKDDSSYLKLISDLKVINPRLKVIGLSATPFRLGMGMLTEGKIFTDICCNMCTPEKFNWFIEKGHLAPLIPQPTATELDVSNVQLSCGDFKNKELQTAVDKIEITKKAISEALTKSQNRRCGIVFASGIEHAEHISDELKLRGETAEVVHSKMKNKKLRKERIDAHKNGSLKWIVNNGVLTTGYDNPMVDVIIDLRPTMSPGLHIQKLGRGTRPCEGKKNCLVLDFAGNTPRLGPVNDPIIPRKKGKGTGDAPIKQCKICSTYHHPSAKFCVCCGAEFPFEIKIKSTSGDYELIRDTSPKYKTFDVTQAFYTKHTKKTPNSIKVTYLCGIRSFDEYVCPEHSSFAGKLSRDWWEQRNGEITPPEDCDVFIKLAPHLVVPKRVKVHINNTYNKKIKPKVVGYEF